jgi:hypothetical protein
MAGARIVSISTDVIDLARVLRLEEHPTRAAAPTLLLQELRQAWADVRVPALSRAPVHPIAIRGTAIAPDLPMPRHRPLTMGVEVDGVRSSGRGGEDTAGVEPMPVPLYRPPDGLRRVSSMCPAAELDPREVIKPRIHGFAHRDAVLVGPPGFWG